ncbi:MAG: single-stranded-DNA-specific exonuclease RecJ [Candidatus Aminicenantes bacterium]|nr:single-stranded-DNA-specific exonuclease RecJ [Candidatus Aminicenantes bacterium]MDH5743303.1 single-stranded-DNA-specific exonuclease RecJ [Candidatus Aminicenantes bacterium]
MSHTIWILDPVSERAKRLSLDLGVPVEIAQILINRGIERADEAYRFLHGTLSDLYDPFLMDGMREAVNRIRKAITQKERILIFGDYDVDGILSVVSLSKALQSLGGNVDFFIPDRLKEGYGLKEKYIDLVIQKQANLVISVDCGIKALAFVDKAKRRGIDVIITDHHQPGPTLPAALAVLNPALPDSGYPYKHLAGIGVVFKLIQALFDVESKSSLLPHYLKLVSMGTIADIVELKDENRIFVKFGLKGLEEVVNIGLKSLMDTCGISGRRVSAGDVGFRIGPRINAAGRMGITDLAVRLFFSDSLQEAEEIVRRLDKLNSKRQRVEEKVFNQAKDRVTRRFLDKRYKLLLLGCEEWHRGVIGIVASKIKDVYYRPVILFAYEDGKAYGSGRSIQEFSLIDCLDKHKKLFLNYGGHTMAVGCELVHKNMKPFKEAINVFVASRITKNHLKRKLHIDAKLNFGDIDFSLIEILSLLSPFGLGNPKPLFLTERAEVAGQPRKIQGKHSRFLVKKDGRVFEALGWRRGEWADQVKTGDRVDLVYTLQVSEYLGEEKLNLSLEDMRIP